MRPELATMRLNDRRSIDTAAALLDDGELWSANRLAKRAKWCWRRAVKALRLLETLGWATPAHGGWHKTVM